MKSYEQVKKGLSYVYHKRKLLLMELIYYLDLSKYIFSTTHYNAEISKVFKYEISKYSIEKILYLYIFFIIFN
jgi:hypothetical protein